MKNFFLLSIAQKYLMGLTGLGLAGFVLVHMLGNLLIFAGEKSYNLYAHKLVQNPFIVAFEIGLLALFFTHIVLALVLSLKNVKARPQKYAKPAKGLKATPLYQKSLLAQGAVILVFVILHLITFKFGTYYEVVYEGEKIRDIFRVVVEAFQNPVTVLWYVIALLILAFHLFHGLNSSFQSLGFYHPRFTPWINKMSFTYAFLVTTGYIALPIYIFVFK